MMLLAKMEDYSNLFPSLCMEDAFQLIDSYDNGLYGRKKKKKLTIDLAECRLYSPCNSPEVIMSGVVEDSAKKCPKLLHSNNFTDAQDSADYGSTFSGVDMEGFCEINASMTANEDIMLSSSANESKMVLKEIARNDLSQLTVEGAHDVSGNGSSASDSSRLQSEFESDVDVLLDNCLWRNKEVDICAHAYDLLPDLSGLALSGYLLSDIPSHPDLSCEANGSVDSLLTYCANKHECLNTYGSPSHTEHQKEDLSNAVKGKGDSCPQDPREAVYSDFDALCTNTLLDDMQSNMNGCPRMAGCRCRGHDCMCYKSETSSAEEEDVCIEYIVSHKQAKVRTAKGRSACMVRRGPGRPRKVQNTEFIRRGPGRPRKKSVSDAVVWYQTRRKRTVSFSNGYKSGNRQKSLSDDKDAQNRSRRAHICDSAVDKMVNPKGSHRGEMRVQLSSDCQPAFESQRLHSLQSIETDEEDIVDVVSIGDEFQELYGVSTMAELVQHINQMHNYHTQRFMACRSWSTESASARQSTSKFSINLSMPAKRTPSSWSDSVTILSDGRRRRVAMEQRTKREALNDLERRRRYALARELSSLREVIPEMKEGFRAAKVVILAAAENHIRLLERKLRRDQSILKSERERHMNLKARLQALSVDANS